MTTVTATRVSLTADTTESTSFDIAQDYRSQFRRRSTTANAQAERAIPQPMQSSRGDQIFTGICSNTPQGEIPRMDNQTRFTFATPLA